MLGHTAAESGPWAWRPGRRADGQVWVQILALVSLLHGFGLRTQPVSASVSHSGKWNVSTGLAG